MNNIYVWLEEVCRPLKYKPDHDAAYKELKDHYQDHLDNIYMYYLLKLNEDIDEVYT